MGRDLFKRAFEILFAYDQEQASGKSPLRSKTIWTMVIATAAVLSSKYVGIELSAEEQTMIVAGIGIVMRLVTKSPVGFYESGSGSLITDNTLPSEDK